MSGGGITESIVEQAALDWFRSLGYATLPGPSSRPAARRPSSSYDQVVLTGRLRDAALRINPDLPTGVVEQAVTGLLRAEVAERPCRERARAPAAHRRRAGRARTATGEVRTALVWLVDWEKPTVNDWLFLHQFTVVEASKNRRADVVVARSVEPGADLPSRRPGAVPRPPPSS